MSNFKAYKQELRQHVASLFAGNNVLFHTTVGGDELWQWFVDSLPEHLRAEYTCNACRSFIKHFGGLVAIGIDNVTRNIWQFETQQPEFEQVNEVLSNVVAAGQVRDVFVPKSEQSSVVNSRVLLGVDANVAQIHDENNRPTGQTVRWEHLSFELSATYFFNRQVAPEAEQAKYRDHAQVLKRSFESITGESLALVKDLIAQNSLYRGAENLHAITEFEKLRFAWAHTPESARTNFCWKAAVAGHPESVLRFKNTAIGTLLTDLSEGEDVNVAVGKFESKVAPANYKRPAAVVTPRMIQDAEKTVVELGLEHSLARRQAVMEDLTVNNALFVDRSRVHQASGRLLSGSSLLAQTLGSNQPVNPKQFSKVDTITLKDLVANVLPTASKLEVLLENRHEANLVSLIAPQEPSAPSLFKWNNNFSWSYSKGVADAMRERVVARGGSVDGVLRFTHQWNDEGRNASLMDLHVFLPGSSKHDGHTGDYYPSGPRVGWNMRQNSASRGVQDVDYVDAAPPGYVPVENITFPSLQFLKDGKYTFKIHNWDLRQPTTSGFRAQIAFQGTVYDYHYPNPLQHKQWVTVAEAELHKGVFDIDHKLQPSSASKKLWGLDTYQFQPVAAVTYSPNYWGENFSGVGNQHVFFLLTGAKHEGAIRGFYNEFLDARLDRHRRVFETLGGKLTPELSDEGLSGVGFATTGEHEFVLKVSSNSGLERMLRVIV